MFRSTCNRLTHDAENNLLEYDNEGNRIRKTAADGLTKIEYTYDHRNRLTEIRNYSWSGGAWVQNKTIDYRYDVFDRRIGRTADNNNDGVLDAEAAYVYDGENLVLQFNKSSSGNMTNAELTRRLLYGPAVDQVFDVEFAGTNEVRWFLADNQGSIRDVLKFDNATNASTLLDHLDYDSYGNFTQTNANYQPGFLYNAKGYDADAQLYYYRARWYDPKSGRFVNEDPIGFAAGDANLYRYCGNSPVNFTDPSGMYPYSGGGSGGSGGTTDGGWNGHCGGGWNGLSISPVVYDPVDISNLEISIIIKEDRRKRIKNVHNKYEGHKTWNGKKYDLRCYTDVEILAKKIPAGSIKQFLSDSDYASLSDFATILGLDFLDSNAQIKYGGYTITVFTDGKHGVWYGIPTKIDNDSGQSNIVGWQFWNDWDDLKTEVDVQWFLVTQAPPLVLFVGGGAIGFAEAAAEAPSFSAYYNNFRTKLQSTIPVYRAVSPAEYQDILKSNAFRQGPNSLEGKWFADSLKGAQAHGNKLYPDGKFFLIEAEVPNNAPSLFRQPNLDGLGGATYLHLDDLNGVTPYTVR